MLPFLAHFMNSYSYQTILFMNFECVLRNGDCKLLFRGGFGSTSAPCTKIVCGLVHFLAISLNTIACSDTSFHPSPLFLQAIAANLRHIGWNHTKSFEN